MCDEIHHRRRVGCVIAAVQKVVIAFTARGSLESVDAAEAAVIEQNNDQLLAKRYRCRDFRIQHEVAAIADQNDDVPFRLGQLDAKAAGNLISHAGVAVFDVVTVLIARTPKLV